MDRYINTPLDNKTAKTLKAGDYVYITGTIYTARDAAHKRMDETLNRNESLPIDVNGNIIYYMGPSPAREGRPIGSAGPTTATRMDKYAPRLLDMGLIGMIGKGKRQKPVVDAIIRNGAVYFAAVGGAGALLAQRIIKSEVVAYLLYLFLTGSDKLVLYLSPKVSYSNTLSIITLSFLFISSS